MALGNRDLQAFEHEYADILALGDPGAAFRRIVATVPRLTGVDMAWVGDVDGTERLVLRHSVNGTANVVDGLVVPIGVGLGGQVMVARRLLWVSDYRTADTITHHFNRQVVVEGMHGMVAAPIAHGKRLFGVLYGATRARTEFGDRAAGTLTERADLLAVIADRAATAAVAAERALRAAEVAVAEERNRIAIDLHDTVGAMLFTIGEGIRRLGDELSGNAVASARVKAIGSQTAEASVALRRSLRALNTPSEKLALTVALRQDCRAFQERTTVPARLIVLTEVPALDPAKIDAIERAVREALLNVEKHAEASSVVVTVFAVSGRLMVAISDDGVGLTTERAAGLGLASATERLSRVGGELCVAPGDDGGVTVQAWIPTAG